MVRRIAGQQLRPGREGGKPQGSRREQLQGAEENHETAEASEVFTEYLEHTCSRHY